MDRVQWGAYGGEDIETVIAVMLLRRHPGAIHRRPGQGDNGIDVYVPLPDGSWRCYQIKKHTGALTSSIEGQIKKSLARAIEFAKDKGISVSEWLLLRPENGTERDRQFIADLDSSAPFPVGDAGGRSFCEGLVADYPQVVDYYLHGGRDSVDERARSYLRAARFLEDATGDGPVFTPASVESELPNVHAALNASDPHYRYDFHVIQRPPNVAPDDPAWPDLTSRALEPMLMASTSIADPDRAVVFDIYARFDEAPKFRPLTSTFTVSNDLSDEDLARWNNFLRFGEPVESIAMTMTDSTLPGAAKEPQEALVTVLDHPERPLHLTLHVLGPDGAELHSVDLHGPPVRRGLLGGESATVADERELLRVRIRASENRPVDFTIEFGDLVGQPVAVAARAAEVRAAIGRPNQLRLSVTDGPMLAGADDLGDQQPFPDILASALHDLVEIQKRSARTILLPALHQITENQARSWTAAARVLRGEQVPVRVDRVQIGSAARVSVGDVITPEYVEDLRITVGQQRVTVGQVVVTADNMKVVAVEKGEQEGIWHITAEPEQGTETWASITLGRIARGVR